MDFRGLSTSGQFAFQLDTFDWANWDDFVSTKRFIVITLFRSESLKSSQASGLQGIDISLMVIQKLAQYHYCIVSPDLEIIFT